MGNYCNIVYLFSKDLDAGWGRGQLLVAVELLEHADLLLGEGQLVELDAGRASHVVGVEGDLGGHFYVTSAVKVGERGYPERR